jgi:hypothetical protein
MGIFSQIYSARFINAESFIEEMLLAEYFSKTN